MHNIGKLNRAFVFLNMFTGGEFTVEGLQGVHELVSSKEMMSGFIVRASCKAIYIQGIYICMYICIYIAGKEISSLTRPFRECLSESTCASDKK